MRIVSKALKRVLIILKETSQSGGLKMGGVLRDWRRVLGWRGGDLPVMGGIGIN